MANAQTITISGANPAIPDLFFAGTVDANNVNPNTTYTLQNLNFCYGQLLPLDAGTNKFEFALPNSITVVNPPGPGGSGGIPFCRALVISRFNNYWEIYVKTAAFTMLTGLRYGMQPLYRCRTMSFDANPPCNAVWEKASGLFSNHGITIGDTRNFSTGIYATLNIAVAAGAVCNPATTCQFTGAGPWSSAFNWSCSDGTNHVPTTTDIAIVMPGSSITLTSDVHVFDFHNYGTLYLGIPPGPYYSISAP